jgi:hypothetical protein
MEEKAEVQNYRNQDLANMLEALANRFSRFEANLSEVQNDIQTISIRVSTLERSSPTNSSGIKEAEEFHTARVFPEEQKNKKASVQNGPGDSDPDHSASDDDNFDPRLPKTPKARGGNSRRTSIFQKTLSQGDANATRLVLQAKQPDYSHIFLKYLTVRAVFTFFEAIRKYETSYQVKLPVATLIADNLRETIIAMDKTMTDEKFYCLSNKTLYKTIQRLILPLNKPEFHDKLSANVTFSLKPNYRPSPTDFRHFYEMLLLYRQNFRKVFELLAEKNASAVPKIDNKEGGIIKLFLSKIPYEYGTRVFKCLDQQKFDNIDTFMDSFYNYVEGHNSISKAARTFGQCFGGTEYKGKAADNSYLANIDSNMEEQPTEELQTEYQIGYPSDDESGSELEDQIAAMQELKPSAKREGPLVCFTKITHGVCTKPGCKYEHKEEFVAKAREQQIERMKRLNSAPSKTALLQRPKHNVPHQSFSCILETSVAEQFREDFILSNIMPASWFVRSIHKEGTIGTDAGNIPIQKVLFDSGATTASYISSDFVSEHFELLEPYIESVKGKVKLAAADVEVAITQRLRLTVSFSDSTGRVHTSEVYFYALPGSHNSMVIGFPAIVASFGSLFIDMVKTAIDEYAGEPSHELTSLQDGLLDPWTVLPEEEAPEDIATDLPCSFTDALHFMEMSYEEAKEEFFSQIEEHVSAEFRSATKVVELLKTQGVKAFVPSNWEGIKGIPPLELQWKTELPERMRPKARPVNPKLFEAAQLEFSRLCKYMYKPSNSPIASCLVIAPKATKPFIRFCGDYVGINKYINVGHFPIPHVQRSLDKIAQYKVFLDVDLVNAFHQVKLAALTSERLSVQTPWGQVAPQFMPEGIAPATFILQETISNIFKDFDEFVIAIFDNLLVLAHDYDDAYRKLELVIQKSIEHNLYLKFSKSWLGFDRVNFFGYVCKKGSYGLSDDRKQALTAFDPPKSLKQMQSFLGAALYFKGFVPNYSTLAAPLHEMTKQSATWNNDTWNAETLAAFAQFKGALQSSFNIFYPDYSLPWVLRTDASQVGVGSALFQLFQETPSAEIVYQPILFASEKFSDPARRWSTIEQEAYACYFGIKKCSYYLRCKSFILETDHRNLQWIEQSQVPKVTRWRIFMQSFHFSIRHIPGRDNRIADWLSRIPDDSPDAEPLHAMEGEREVGAPKLNLLDKVHGGRMGHHGARKTWTSLNELFPGHRIPFRVVQDYVSSCAVCQKDRLGLSDALQPAYRTLLNADKRRTVGVDTLTISPMDKFGNLYVTVIVVHATKLVALYPSPNKDALSTAMALFKFFSTYGVYERLASDPGSDLTSEVIDHLTSWYGIRHVFSLVDRHESNGVEGSNKSILRHLKALVADERVADRWSDPTIIYLVQYMLNAQVSSETGLSPFHAHFGTEDATYFRLPDSATVTQTTQEFVRLLDENLKTLWEISESVQRRHLEERGANVDPELQNQYQKGDLVLFQFNAKGGPAPSKLAMKYMGPYEVLSQHKNDVECRHLSMKTVHKFDVCRLKIFTGSRDEAERVARIDHDQYELDCILYYRGNPSIRTTMEFWVRYKDGEEKWLTWSKDLFDTVQYEAFCRSKPPLFPLLFSAKEAAEKAKLLNKQAITKVQPGDRVFVDLRSRGGATWYNAIGLPDAEKLTYVLACEYGAWVSPKRLKIKLNCAITNEQFSVDHTFVVAYGSVHVFDATYMVLVDKKLCREYPTIMPH